MKGQELWNELERRGREKYKLANEWILCAVDIRDDEIAKIEFGRKGPRGGWKRESGIKGMVVWSDLNERTQEDGRT